MAILNHQPALGWETNNHLFPRANNDVAIVDRPVMPSLHPYQTLKGPFYSAQVEVRHKHQAIVPASAQACVPACPINSVLK